MKTRAITLTINGEEYNITVPAHHTLLQVIRDQLNLTDVKYGCGRGECGACTVLLDEGTKKGKRKAILACMVLAATMDGKSITTAAGLEKDGKLHPVQEAMGEVSAIQCGYCSPGVALKGVSILEKNPKATEQEIRRELEGNICRCTGYVKIVEAMELARDRMAAAGKSK